MKPVRPSKERRIDPVTDPGLDDRMEPAHIGIGEGTPPRRVGPIVAGKAAREGLHEQVDTGRGVYQRVPDTPATPLWNRLVAVVRGAWSRLQRPDRRPGASGEHR